MPSSSSGDSRFKLPTIEEIQRAKKEQKPPEFHPLGELSRGAQNAKGAPEDKPAEPEKPLLTPEEAAELAKKTLDEAKAEAEKIVQRAWEKAEREAENILTTAKANQNEVYEQARQKAREDFIAEREESDRQFAATLDGAYVAAIENLRAQGDDFFEQLKIYILQTALNVTEKILFVEFDRSDEALQNMIMGAIEQLNDKNSLTVRVSPWEYERFFAHDDKYITFLKSKIPEIEVRQDDSFEKGEVKVSSASETVGAGVGQRMEKLGLALETFRKNTGSE